ncbi:MAG TPA: HD domain-containing phosphohydrolase [Pyrinomonadaceae bacterium]|nr:HD domain-containing phosphohydrolase [Pyrinomonadaceae bacterium]
MSRSKWKRAATLTAVIFLADALLTVSAVSFRFTHWQEAALCGGLLSALLLPAFLFFSLASVRERGREAARAAAERLRRSEETARLRLSTVESLAMAIDAKDQTTHGHVRRTQIYAVELGRVLGASEAELEALRDGALLHDIGKLAVPEYILNKPGKLTAAEFEKMKIHASVGGDIVRRVNFPYPVEAVVRHHHERWDGTGYPAGLAGEEIPLAARVIAVADFYDTTRCDRPYRAGLSRDESLRMLAEMSGTSFDPRVVAQFIAHLERFESLIPEEVRREQVPPEASRTPTGDGSRRAADHSAGFRTIAQAQREVFALHEIAQAIGSSLSLQDTAALVAGKLRAIVPFDTCVIYVVDERAGRAEPVFVAGAHAELFEGRGVQVGEGITGWVIANARPMSSASPELELAGAPAGAASRVGGVLSAPLVREEGAFGAVTLFSAAAGAFAGEHVRLLETVCLHASGALSNALMHERTRESALTDPLTELPNERALHLILDQRVAECQRAGREPFAVLCLNLDDFRGVNERYGHGVGDRLLAAVAGVCKGQLRQMDVLARREGDEFVAVMPTATAEVAALVAERVRAAVESHSFAVRTGRTARVRMSAGAACFPADGETAGELLLAAARAMRRDKGGRKLGPGALASDSASVVPIDSYR